MASASVRVTMFTTNSPVSSTFLRLSFGSPLALSDGLYIRLGGFAPPAMKKLNGARFSWPPELIVLTKAIGRGWMTPTKRSYIWRGVRLPGSIETNTSSLWCAKARDNGPVRGAWIAFIVVAIGLIFALGCGGMGEVPTAICNDGTFSFACVEKCWQQGGVQEDFNNCDPPSTTGIPDVLP